ncbi:MAG TPA: 50S ribosomal protein L21 [Kiritimatiellia bacterium]|nr:50S ribosomal protein L21 [Kiritimatiellia bacterium]HRZ12645.1 50S ribosomal protein L21 [Kiritimatiellia bacterium]HSA19587.1 50S ribosomal protein L21 [Kiritimatiellia bacterium]
MDAYAVVETGGKQYLVRPGEVVRVERIAAKAGDKVALAPVLAVCSGQAATVIGAPVVEGATVTATVARELREDKVVSFKKKRRKGYRKKIGHRQTLTELKIEAINAP